MAEYRRDHAAFYEKYGGGDSVGYDLIGDDGYRYPPAAIVQSALDWPDVKGGLKAPDSAGRALRANGFRVVGKRGYRKRKPKAENDLLEKLKRIDKTEAANATKRRIGSKALRDYVLRHRVECEVTGVSEEPLLRVSHIVPWSKDKDARLNPENVILLSALWDAAFDRGLVSFCDDGMPLYSDALSDYSREVLEASQLYKIAVSNERSTFLAKHRARYKF